MNPLTLEIESRLGAAYIVLLSLFFIGLMFIALKNFNFDMIVMESNQVRIRTISSTERQLMEIWVFDNDIEIPEGEGYRYLIRQYPEKPWLR